MELTLRQLLALIGPLDDTPGFDSPRERFRRFLVERVTDPAIARHLIEQCIHTPGQQGHRALQDLVILLGRFLKFETAFGVYDAAAPAFGAGGEWRSRRRLTVAVAVWTDQTPSIDPAAVAAALFADSSANAEGAADVALGVVTPLFPASARLQQLGPGQGSGRLRALSLRGLLTLADMMEAGRLSHDVVVELLAQNPLIDSLVDLLDQAAAPALVLEAPMSVSDRTSS